VKIHKNPKLFEFDETEEIVDVFVKEDLECPYPFTNGEWYHQGFYLSNFIIFVNDLFERNNLPYEVIKKE
jgi:hypothetical protein